MSLSFNFIVPRSQWVARIVKIKPVKLIEKDANLQYKRAPVKKNCIIDAQPKILTDPFEHRLLNTFLVRNPVFDRLYNFEQPFIKCIRNVI